MQKGKRGPCLHIFVRLFVIGWLFIHDVQLCLAQSAQERGQEIFAEKCTECHTIGFGAVAGPDLNNVR
jgi:cytochrome c2